MNGLDVFALTIGIIVFVVMALVVAAWALVYLT